MRRLIAALLLGSLLAVSVPATAWEGPKIKGWVTKWSARWVENGEYWRVKGWVKIKNKTDNLEAISCIVGTKTKTGRPVGSQRISKAIAGGQTKSGQFDIFGPYGSTKEAKKPTRVKVNKCWIY